MKNFSRFIFAACLLVGVTAFSSPKTPLEMVRGLNLKAVNQLISSRATFTVGDTANYNVTITQLNDKGTAQTSVTAVTSTEVTITAKVAIAGQNETEVEVFNSQTGAVVSITVNGQAQTLPGPDTVISQTNETITVPAGTFATTHVVFDDAQKNQDDEWIDAAIPVGGTVQANTTSQGYTINEVLTSYSMAGKL